MTKRIWIMALVLGCGSLCYAQQESHNVRKGNKHYQQEKYTEAEVEYRRGMEANEKSFEAQFNLGDALFRQGKYPEAAEAYTQARNLAKEDKARLAACDHNIGNALYAQQQFGKAVEAYKSALRNAPKDDETRYNLVKAMQQQQEQEQQQQNQNQQNQEQQDKQQQDKQQQENQNQEQQQEQQEQQEQEQKMDKQTAEQLLQALEQDEKETQEKAKRQQTQGGKRVEKDW